MPGSLFNTRELAEYLDVHEKQVYKLLARGVLPGTRVTGKWLFPKDLVDRWLETSSLQNLAGSPVADRPLVVAAEPDLFVDEFLHCFSEATGRVIARTAATMDDALRHLQAGTVDLGIVEFTRNGCRWPFPPQLARLNNGACQLVHLGKREMVIAWIGRKPIQSLGDLRDRTLAARAPGAASRTLLDHRILRNGGDPSQLRLVPVASHLDAALAVVRGETDLAVIPRDEAQRTGLSTWTLAELDVELVVPEAVAECPTTHDLLALLASSSWRSRAERLAGVDARSTGNILDIPLAQTA